MRILKILYICWIVFWAFGCILGGVMGYNATFGGILYIYFYYKIFISLDSSNNFIRIQNYFLILKG